MNSLVAQMMGRKPVQEDDAVPLPGIRQADSTRDRDRIRARHNVRKRNMRSDGHGPQRRMAAAIMGMAEAEDDDESIIPDDADEMENVTGPSGMKVDREREEQDQEADEPDHPSEVLSATEPLLTPKDALVAPDVTPQALEPIDPSEVPASKHQPAPETHAPPRFVPPQTVNPMDVLLGRRTPAAGAPAQPPEQVVTAEAAQATVNTVLNVGGVSGEGLLRAKQPMPDPTPGRADKIMEAFSKYGPKPTWTF